VSQARFQKQQREKARRERAAAKFARKEERREQRTEPTTTSSVDQAALVADLAALHERFDKGELELDDFLAAKDDLTERLQIT
jgi:hypothetical protein